MKINSYDRQNFQGARLKRQSFECFREYALKSGFLERYSQVIHPSNYVNEGLCNQVYRIPDNPDFLLRVRKRPVQRQNLGITPVFDSFPELNIGQEIARLDENVGVVIAQKGEPCGIRHWAGRELLPMLPEDKTKFLSYISTIAGFPFKAYEDLVREMQTVNRLKNIDVHNPQNILYDTENMCFNIVDVTPKDRFREMLSPIAVASQLCDFRNLFSVLKTSDAKESELVLESVNSINKQVKQASKNNGLNPSIKLYLHKICCLFRAGRQDEIRDFMKFRSLYNGCNSHRG